jgi:hypothetical protein
MFQASSARNTQLRRVTDLWLKWIYVDSQMHIHGFMAKLAKFSSSIKTQLCEPSFSWLLSVSHLKRLQDKIHEYNLVDLKSLLHKTLLPCAVNRRIKQRIVIQSQVRVKALHPLVVKIVIMHVHNVAPQTRILQSSKMMLEICLADKKLTKMIKDDAVPESTWQTTITIYTSLTDLCLRFRVKYFVRLNKYCQIKPTKKTHTFSAHQENPHL